MSELNVSSMTLADGVIETVVAIAVGEVDGVAGLAQSSAQGLFDMLRSKPSTQGIEVVPEEDGRVAVTARIVAASGHVLPELAQAVRDAVAEAVLTQVGLEVSRVDVLIDAIDFSE